MEGKVFVISAPSGTGKSTLVTALTQRAPERFARVVTVTTRAPRQGEVEGEDYHFVCPRVFDEKKEKTEFLEIEPMFGYLYATPKKGVYDALASGKHVLLVIGVGGALQLRKKIDAVYIFIAPPSMKELEDRMRLRAKDSEEQIARRIERAERELEDIEAYDYLIVNEKFDRAVDVLESIITAEEHRIHKETK